MKTMLLVILAGWAGCGGEGAMPYDESAPNAHLEGRFFGRDLDVTLRDDASLAAVREYRGPFAPGTDPVDCIPDLATTVLSDVAVTFQAVIDGGVWNFELDHESVDPASFGEGTLEVVGDDDAGPGRVVFEVEMVSGEAQYERTGVSGTVEVRTYSGTPAPEGAHVIEGGSFGATFELFFGPGEELRGSFFVPFIPNNIEPEDC